MPQKKKQETGTGSIVGGSALTAYGAANAPVLRGGSRSRSQMVGASPKLQGKRYQAELHGAMQRGAVPSDSTVKVFRTPSGRHINAGGTHRKIARDAMGKPSRYEVKNIDHEIYQSPLQKLTNKRKLNSLKRGSEAAQAGKKVRPVGNISRKINETLADAADMNDDRVWRHPGEIKPLASAARKAGLGGAAVLTGTGALLAGSGLAQRKEYKQKVGKSMTVSAFGVEHGYDEVSKSAKESYYQFSQKRRNRAAAGAVGGAIGGGLGGAMAGGKLKPLYAGVGATGGGLGGGIGGAISSNPKSANEAVYGRAGKLYDKRQAKKKGK